MCPEYRNSTKKKFGPPLFVVCTWTFLEPQLIRQVSGQ